MPAKSAVSDEFALLVARFAALTDSRCARGKVHPLPGVLELVVLGLPAGRRSLSAVSRYGAIHPEVLAPLGPRRGRSVATLHRLLAMATPAVDNRCKVANIPGFALFGLHATPAPTAPAPRRGRAGGRGGSRR